MSQTENLRKEIEGLLSDAQNYLTIAKTKKGKEAQNFEAMLAWEFAIKARDKSRKLRENGEYYESVNRRVQIILDEAKEFPLSRREKESEYEAGDVAGG